MTGDDDAQHSDDGSVNRWILVREYVAIAKAADPQFVMTRLVKYAGDLEAFKLSEPIYRGREVWDWLEQLTDADEEYCNEATQAFKAMGPRAVPWLETVIFSEDRSEEARATAIAVCVQLLPEVTRRRALGWMLCTTIGPERTLVNILCSLNDDEFEELMRTIHRDMTALGKRPT